MRAEAPRWEPQIAARDARVFDLRGLKKVARYATPAVVLLAACGGGSSAGNVDGATPRAGIVRQDVPSQYTALPVASEGIVHTADVRPTEARTGGTPTTDLGPSEARTGGTPTGGQVSVVEASTNVAKSGSLPEVTAAQTGIERPATEPTTAPSDAQTVKDQTVAPEAVLTVTETKLYIKRKRKSLLQPTVIRAHLISIIQNLVKSCTVC